MELLRNPEFQPPVDLTPRVTIIKLRLSDNDIEVRLEGVDFRDYVLVSKTGFLLGLRLRLAKRKLLKRYWLARKLSD